jgi:hypothetical protein
MLAAFLLLAGLYFPTAHGETILVPLHLILGGLLLVAVAGLLLRRRGCLGGVSLVCSAAIVGTLLIATLFSPFTQITYGAVMPYLLLATLLSVRLSDIPLTASTRRLFGLVHIVNLTAGALIVARVPELCQFLVSNYSAAYPELVPYMLDEGKPVLSFGSHSIAGFFFYVFFYLSFQTFRAGLGRRHLAAAIGYIGLMLCLNSFTAYLAAAIACGQLVLHFQIYRSALTGLLASLLLLTVGTLVAVDSSLVEPLQHSLNDVMESDANGFIGRYSRNGALAANLDYLAQHPFEPVGMGFSNLLFYGDSGPIEHLTRGSFPLLAAVYCGFYLFLRGNLWSRGEAAFLFAAYMGFEIGYSNLNYIRTLYLLPFVVIYLNGLGRVSGRLRA